MSVDPNRKVRVALDEDNFLIQAGDPTAKEIDKDYIRLMKKGYTVKTIPYSEYQNLKWIYDKPKK